MIKTLRLWLDEYERLPLYEYTIPTGFCHGKTWRVSTDPKVLLVGMYWTSAPGRDWTLMRPVVLRQGPRRPLDRIAPLPVRTSCCS